MNLLRGSRLPSPKNLFLYRRGRFSCDTHDTAFFPPVCQAIRVCSSSIVAAPTIDSSAAAVRFRLLVTTFYSSHSTALPNCYGRLTGFLNWVFRHPGPQKDPRTIVTAATVPCPVKQGGYYSIDYKEPIKFLGPVLKPLTNLWGMSPQIFSLAVGL